MCIRDSEGALSGSTISWASGPLANQTWTADWVVSGHFVYSSSEWPYPRFDAYQTTLTGDRSTGTYSAGGVTWSDGTEWSSYSELFTATLSGHTLTWNSGPVWNVISLMGSQLQELEVAQTYSVAASKYNRLQDCLLYTSPSPRDATLSRMPSSA